MSDRDLLDAARSRLRDAQREMAPGAFARMRTGLDQRLKQTGQQSLRWWVLAATTACLLAFLVPLVPQIDRPEGPRLASGRLDPEVHVLRANEPVRVRARARLEGENATIDADAGAELAWVGSKVVLTAGRLVADVDRVERPFVVETPLAAVRVVGTRFTIVASRTETFVRVARGSVEVRPNDGRPAVTLAAGQETRVRHRIETAQRTREDDPPAARPPPDNRPSVADQPPEPPRRPARPKRSKPSRRPKRPDRRAGGRAEVAPSPGPARAVVPEAKAPVVAEPPEHPTAAPSPEAKVVAPAPEAREALVESPPIPDRPRAKTVEQNVERAHRPEPSPAPIEALLAEADRLRAEGRARQAAERLAEVAVHPDGGPFAEEALLRRAVLLAGLGERRAALATLDAAQVRFPDGTLLPERVALSARLYLEADDPERALAVIETSPESGLELQVMRIRIGEALASEEPTEARRAVAPLLAAKARSIKSRALAVAARAAQAAGDYREARRLREALRSLTEGEP